MKKFYESPEWDITKVNFPNLLSMDSGRENPQTSGDDTDEGDIF